MDAAIIDDMKLTRLIQSIGYKKIENHSGDDKYRAELEFWQKTLDQYVEWYEGRLKTLYGEKSPNGSTRVRVNTVKDSAILTWELVHQQKKYLQDLKLTKKAFAKGKLLDIGSGPHPSARVFLGVDLYCLDPLIPRYAAAGFPLHYYDSTKYVVAHAEEIPVTDRFFDAVISVNALDHVDDFERTALEIKRVLKKNGKLRFHLHYHKGTTEEPIELTDERVASAFSWDKKFRKIGESRTKRGTKLTTQGEKYTLWSNF